MTAHLTRVRSRVAIHAHRKVRGLLEGEYASSQVGRSMDFNDLREYVRGDDVKDIDWLATARTGELLVKRFSAIRKHIMLIAVTTGRGMAALNDVNTPKRDLAVLVTGVVADLATRHGDQVAVVYGDSSHQDYLRPGAGLIHVERCLGAVHDAITPEVSESDLMATLEFLARVVRRKCLLLIVTDDTSPAPGMEQLLRRLAVQHEVMVAGIGDLDPTTHRVDGLIDVDTRVALPRWLTRDQELQRSYTATVAAEDQSFRRLVESTGGVYERVVDNDSAIRAVFQLLERHRHAKRR